jgi:hypothetical protein
MFVALFEDLLSTLVSEDKPRSGAREGNFELSTIEPGVHDNYSKHSRKTQKAGFIR